MSSYEYDRFDTVTLLSSYKPLLGQTHRSSYDYDMTELNVGQQMRWLCPEGVTFDVYEDRFLETDEILAKDVTNGQVTSFFYTSLYIANPRCTQPCDPQGILIRLESTASIQKADG